MRCACKALFYAFLADVGTMCVTARNDLKVEKKAAMGRIMDSIGELLQTHGQADIKVLSNLRALASQVPSGMINPASDWTPPGSGVTETTNDILVNVIKQIELTVESTISNGHKDTQDAINEAMTAFEVTSDRTVSKKKIADAADTAWFNCIRQERSMLVDHEQRVTDEASSRSSAAESCQIQDDEKPFEAAPNVPAFHCDISLTGNCDSQIAEYRKLVTGILATVQKNMATEKTKYTEAATACSLAEKDAAQKQSAMTDAMTEFDNHKNICLNLHETRMVDMCSFGEDLTRKCETMSAYSELIAFVDQANGGEHSQPDREQEWMTTSKVKCMLSNLIDGIEIDALSLDACANLVDYAKDVGILDKREAEFKVHTSIDGLTCEEKVISFTGKTWETPSGASPESSQYHVADWTPRVDLTPGGDPFAFCGAAAAPLPGKQ